MTAVPTISSSVDQSHGTAVAGLIAAVGNNGIGVIGGAFGASITGVNIFDFDQRDLRQREGFQPLHRRRPANGEFRCDQQQLGFDARLL